MSNGTIYWKRVGRVEIEDNGGRMMSYGGGDGLDFRFNGEKVGGVYSRFTVGVLGLSSTTINNLVVWNPAAALARQRRIRVYAGYETGAAQSPIFGGVVLEAFPSPPPEMWVNFTCLNMNAGNADNVASPVQSASTLHQSEDTVGNPADASIDANSESASEPDAASENMPSGCVRKPRSYVNTRAEEVLAAIADELELSGVRWNATDMSPDTRIDFRVGRLRKNLCKKFHEKFGVFVFEDEGVLVCEDSRKYLAKSGSSGDTSGSSSLMAFSDSSSSDLSVETGLISVSKVTLAGATVRMRLNDRFKLFSWVHLKSKLIPKANGDYCVIKKRHAGHFRGDPWFTELEMIRKGANV